MRAAAVALLAAGAAAQNCSSASCCTCHKGQNNAGKDLSNQPHTESANACCTLCRNTAGCAGYVYTSDNNYCYLKSTWVGDYPDDKVIGSGQPLAECPTPVPAPPVPTPSPDQQPVFLCDQASLKCNSVAPYTPGSTSKENCDKQIQNGTCTPLPPPEAVYRCFPAHDGTPQQCEVVPAGSSGSGGKDLCTAACNPSPVPGPPGPPAPVPCDDCGCMQGCTCQTGKNNAANFTKITDLVPFASYCCDSCKALDGCKYWVYTHFRCYLASEWLPYDDEAGILSGEVQ